MAFMDKYDYMDRPEENSNLRPHASGFYWVREHPNARWHPGLWDGLYWFLVGRLGKVDPKDLQKMQVGARVGPYKPEPGVYLVKFCGITHLGYKDALEGKKVIAKFIKDKDDEGIWNIAFTHMDLRADSFDHVEVLDKLPVENV